MVQQTGRIVTIKACQLSLSVIRSYATTTERFVPKYKNVTSSDVQILSEFIDKGRNILVMTGAGISTESGIPDYRSQGVGLYATSKSRPVIYQDFVKSEKVRQRYWARNFIGWPMFSSVQPNISHKFLKKLEDLGKVCWLVTQNVDALHYKAGSTKLTELHGSTHRVACMRCDYKVPRSELQVMIETLNPTWRAFSNELAPDGDIQLSQEEIEGFQTPLCPKCSGPLKPEIIFFGDNVPKSTVNFVFEKVQECDKVLVIGSSLEVYSGYRFALRASEMKKPISLLNIGPNRADKLADLKIDAKCSDVLKQVTLS
ncbi:NAD-dependent protein lipoamidase sirtuin-4, mitochondrial-like [Saccostrea cucullata]|uniref:NAD-dependent protein lipoamidase sirtuin-4, mitochondrial-like n=1 Tax=Saccostrea cuccullata TaxID=36930 RepID=UPI002ED2B683